MITQDLNELKISGDLFTDESKLVMYATDMLLYHLHSSVNPRKIPDLRKERYNEAKGWLDLVAQREENPDFPENEILDEELIIWGSNPKIEEYI